MAEQRSRGGIHFGTVGGNVSVSAGGDIVAGDKTTGAALPSGFANEGQKQSLLAEVEALREALRDLKAKVDASTEVGADEKDDLLTELLGHVKALREVKDVTAELPAGNAPAPDAIAHVESTLERAGGVLDTLQSVAERGSGLAATVAEFARRYGPLLLSARHLFGLP